MANNISYVVNAVPTVSISKGISNLFSVQSINLQMEIITNLSSNNNKQFLVNKKHENSYPCSDGSNIGFHGIVMSQQVHTISIPYYSEVVKSKPE